MKKIILITLISIFVAGVGISIIQTKLELENKISENTANLEDVSELTFGATLPIAGSTYTLAGSGIISSVSSITLQSFTIPQNGYKIQDSDLSSTFYITLEPGSKKRQEIASCTTVVQNSNDTATLSGCTRGLSPITPFTASTTLRFAHAGGSQVIFSDPPQLFNEYVSLANKETITGQKFFDVFPEFSDGTTPTTTNQFSTKGYVDTIANQGAATSTETIAGISELATRIESASSTPWGVTKPHVQQSQHASSTPSANAFTDNVVWDIWSENDGKLSQLWLDLTEAFTFSGNNTHSGTNIFSNTATFNKAVNINATTTIIANLIANGFIKTFTALEAISAMDAVISTSTPTTTSQMVAKADASAASTTLPFIGFALFDAGGGETVYIQTSGEVSGFSGLATGTLYYLSDTGGSISNGAGTIEGIVGLATDFDTINLDTRANYGMQAMGSGSCSHTSTGAADAQCTITVPSGARHAVGVLQYSNDKDIAYRTAGSIFLSKIGVTAQTHIEYAGASTLTGNASWSGNTITANGIRAGANGAKVQLSVSFYR